MTDIGYVVPTEQRDATELSDLSIEAEESGFDGVCVADRFQPWLPAHGHAPHFWTVLGAIGARTSGFLAAGAVPGARTHPVTVAHASGTLAALFPGRHRLSLSAGDAIDEHVIGEYWPEAHERMIRLFDGVEVVRKLLATPKRGVDVRHRSEYYKVESARLWGAPVQAAPVQVWVGGVASAKRAGRVADGIVVSATQSERMAALVAAAREGAREGGRDPRAVRVTAHLQLCWAPTDALAERQALAEWPMAGLRFPRGDIRSPFDVEHLARGVQIGDVCSSIPVSANPAVHLAELRRLSDLEVDTIHVHNVGTDQHGWFETFAREIRPAFSGVLQ